MSNVAWLPPPSQHRVASAFRRKLAPATAFRLKPEATRLGSAIAVERSMAMGNRLTRWASARLSRRVARSIPVLGAAIAAATVVATMRRKGVISGMLDTGLNSVPGVGAAKNVIEVVRGRDFFPDRPRPVPVRK